MKDDKAGGSTPSQYGIPEGATDLQDLIEHREMNFALGNIFKACYRRGVCEHSDELRDMRKILWFAQREVNRLEAIEAADEERLRAIAEREHQMRLEFLKEAAQEYPRWRLTPDQEAEARETAKKFGLVVDH